MLWCLFLICLLWHYVIHLQPLTALLPPEIFDLLTENHHQHNYIDMVLNAFVTWTCEIPIHSECLPQYALEYDITIIYPQAI